MHDEKQLRGFWKLARIEKLLEGPDKQNRGAVIRIPLRSSSIILRRPLNCLCPLEIKSQSVNDIIDDDRPSEGNSTNVTEDAVPTSRPRRAAAQRAKDWMKVVVKQL